MSNPFPGMNPWLQPFWRDVHARFLVYAADQLNGELPPGLQARVDERLAIDAGGETFHSYLPDVAITEPWDRPAGPVVGMGGQTVVAAEPIVVDLGDEVLRHLEIVDSRAHVITAIELLSPPIRLIPMPRSRGGASVRTTCEGASIWWRSTFCAAAPGCFRAGRC